MNNNGIGFPNLDLYSDHEGGGAESFWPSFTDIMMVIVMIFLLITVSVILNNWQLMNNLKQSVMAEQQALHKAQAALNAAQIKEQENESLEQRLSRIENLLATKTKQLQQSKNTLSTTVATLENLQTEVEVKNEEMASLQSANTTMDEKLEQLNDNFQASTQRVEQLVEQSETTQQALDKAKTEADNMHEEMDALREKSQQGHEQLASLQGEYDSLDKKYQKLLRPARSEKNKHVVKVIYTKKGGAKSYQLQTSGGGKFRSLSRSALNSKLLSLKRKYGDDLYVKIIIPDDSGLSHKEAWKFTSAILNAYDYYHSKDKAKD